MRLCLLHLLLMCFSFSSTAQQHIALYNSNIPNYKQCLLQEERLPNGRIIHVTTPELIAYFPTKSDSLKTAIIICPGGGYQRLAIEHEGYDVAKTLNEMGIAAFVLKYRLPNDTCMTNKNIVPLQNVEQAMHLIKSNAEKYNINANNIGIMGFSAGGHLAAMLSTHYDFAAIANAKDSLLRPAFSVLIYPVITMNDSLCHSGSKQRLIGAKASNADIAFYSCEENVNSKTPPTFLALASDDKVVNPDNSILYYKALRKNNVTAEMHIYQNGGHGFGMNLPNKESWMPLLQKWLLNNNFIK
ncbi:MAG: alpha/beta hydrolase [Chitinophagaceae bacterium]